jgi:hypothetical protein
MVKKGLLLPSCKGNLRKNLRYSAGHNLFLTSIVEVLRGSKKIPEAKSIEDFFKPKQKLFC